MAKPEFRFTLAPELLRREAERDRVERELAALREELEREKAERERRKQELRATRQRKKAEVDKQFEPMGEGSDPNEWMARADFVEELKQREARQLDDDRSQS